MSRPRSWTIGDISGSQTLTDGDHLYPDHINELRQAFDTNATFNVKDFGAVGDGTTDDLTAIRSTISTAEANTYGGTVFFPAGIYYITDSITITSTKVVLLGEGRHLSKILIKSDFNLSATGVIILSSDEPSTNIRDLWIHLEQPDTAVRAELISYPPAIYGTGEPRAQIDRCKISGAMVGIELMGNSGGSSINDLQVASFERGIYIDGALDVVRLNDVHHYFFEMTEDQKTISRENENVGYLIGACDDIRMVNCFTISGGGAVFNTAGTFGYLIGCSFDTRGGVYNTGGASLQLDSCLFTSAVADTMLDNVNGTMLITNCRFSSTINGDEVISNRTNGRMLISNCSFNTDIYQKESIISYSGDLIVQGCLFSRDEATTHTLKTIYVDAGRATIMGNRTTTLTTGSGIFIDINADDYHRAVYNAAAGWTLDFPSPTNGVYTPN